MTELSQVNSLNAPTGFRHTVNICDICPGMTIRYWNIGSMSDEITVLRVNYQEKTLRCLDKAEFTLPFERRVVYIPNN